MSDPPGTDLSNRGRPPKRPRDYPLEDMEDYNSSMEPEFDFKAFTKPGYKRCFQENSLLTQFLVFVEENNDGKIGNKNPLIISNLFKNEVKGVTNIKRLNANKLGVTFSQINYANNFLINDTFLSKYNLRAYIPARAVERIGVIRFVPKNISNQELFKKLASPYEVISVRRFTKKVNGQIKPLETVSVTFLSNNLPESVSLDIYNFHVHEYVQPLLQCFKCFKFNHGAKYCKSSQKCSICSEEHHYLSCTNNDKIKCINCSGQHLAISRDCPIKRNKLMERNNKNNYAKALSSSYSTNIVENYNREFPALPMKQSVVATTNVKDKNIDNEKELIEKIVNNDSILKSLISALVSLGNSNEKLTSNHIKNVIIKKLKNG